LCYRLLEARGRCLGSVAHGSQKTWNPWKVVVSSTDARSARTPYNTKRSAPAEVDLVDDLNPLPRGARSGPDAPGGAGAAVQAPAASALRPSRAACAPGAAEPALVARLHGALPRFRMRDALECSFRKRRGASAEAARTAFGPIQSGPQDQTLGSEGAPSTSRISCNYASKGHACPDGAGPAAGLGAMRLMCLDLAGSSLG